MMGGPTHSPHETHQEEAGDKVERERALAQSFEQSASSSGGSSLPQGLTAAAGRIMTQSEALISKSLNLAAIKTLAEQFGGRVVDVAENSVIVEMTAKSTRLDAFLSLLRPFGILEAARSGESCSFVDLRS